MLSLDMLHPDSPEFIDIKMDKTKVAIEYHEEIKDIF